MPQLSNATERATRAVTLAQSFSLVYHKHVLYQPMDYETGDMHVTPVPERKVWVPRSTTEIQRFALDQFDMLFQTTAEEASFYYMVCQAAHDEQEARGLLISTEDGLKFLDSAGQLRDPTGEFVPNFLPVPLCSDPKAKAEVMDILSEWLGEEEEALSLLRHMATALAPDWPAIRYVLLLGDGRNGKSVLMSMLQRIFGAANCSHVTRQDISKQSPVVTTTLGKLVNIVYDGLAEYLKDSGTEKSLIAGEPVAIRLLYSSTPTMVSTNALFIEGLNREPKSSDKSSALQARLVRFWFPNVYPDDEHFKERMLSDRMSGALLALLIDNFVQPHEKSVMLAPTKKSVELRLEHVNANSIGLQFVDHLARTHASRADALLGMDSSEILALFQQWRYTINDMSVWNETEVMEQLRPVLVTERRSKRVNGVPRKMRVVTRFKPETLAYLALMEGEAHDEVVGE